MENLRETLKMLFLRQSGQKILEKICKGELSVTREIDPSWFVHEFPNSIVSYSYDQKEQIFRLMQYKWMKVSENYPDLAFCAVPTIFNVLHHFTGQCLKEVDGELMCSYKSLLRWHDLGSSLSEDLLITSYLAAKDVKGGIKREDFAWIPVIGHDNGFYNRLFEKPMADLHFHLLGSSLHFDISWLAVMNNPELAKEFYNTEKKEKWRVRKGEGINRYIDIDEIFILLVKACAIRRYLFLYIQGQTAQDEFEMLIDILRQDERGEEEKKEGEELVKEATGVLSQISGITASLTGLVENAFHYDKPDSSDTFAVDYAITSDLIKFGKDNPRYIYSVLAGERYLMYSLFYRVYAENDHRLESLFYLYLIIKDLMRHEMVQLNNEIGLQNFEEYNERKTLASFGRYTNLMKQIAVNSFFVKNKDNYLEVRIQPKEKEKSLKENIKDLDKVIFNQMFSEHDRVNKLNFWYVLHFIKEKDEVSEEARYTQCRHQKLRELLRAQSKASADWKYNEGTQDPNRIVGIDAANTECYCRPEVFAQVFRYLRHYKPTNASEMAKEFKFTYHVGEDFYDIVDGLRAIDEAIRFLELTAGDRLGHALALGIDVRCYYRRCNYTVVMQKQTILDNVAWLLMRGYGMSGYDEVKPYLEEMFEKFYSYVFDENEGVRQHGDYFDALKLRGDEPTGYKHLVDGRPMWTDATEWSEFDKSEGSEYDTARNNGKACLLNHCYHYDGGVKARGVEPDELKVSVEMVYLIDLIQKSMLDDLVGKGIAIECCPTSNLRVGPIRRYRNHPIFRFYNEGLDFGGIIAPRSIPVSINTDDKGIFATSLEREYSLLSSALEKDFEKKIYPNNDQERIFDWMDRVRSMGIEQRFGG